jgi:phosphosulfolactate phosphohydrolase-like enzyme
MKGTSTETKLVMLHNWYTSHGYSEAGSIDDVEYAARVQVGNYLGALRRGGQLDMNNKVQR